MKIDTTRMALFNPNCNEQALAEFRHTMLEEVQIAEQYCEELDYMLQDLRQFENTQFAADLEERYIIKKNACKVHVQAAKNLLAACELILTQLN